MATVAPAIDIAAQATWPITLADSITASRRSTRLTSVRYNHQPKLKDRSTATRKITPSRNKESCEAIIKSDKQEWKYTGVQGNETDSYVLVLSEDGGQKKATLERIDAALALNLIATPTEADADKLQHKYQQLSLAHDEDHDEPEADDGDDDASADSDNPFDYRHFLEEVAVKPVVHHDPPKSTATTPTVRATSRPSKPAPVPAKKRKSAVEPQPASVKKAKTTQQEVKASKAEIPSVRLERKATIPKPSQDDDDDDGELILENDDDAPTGRHHSAMSMALNGQLGSQRGHGPISLHSAASSPASRIQSPAPERPHGDEEFVFGEDEDDVPEEDGDVEHFGLPSPVHDRNTSAKPAVEVEEDDDDDDLEKQLAEAMGQDDIAPVAPEEEESEEE